MAKKLKVRRVKSREERKAPSAYIRLKQGEQFRGFALFEPDPAIELEDNPGFYEFFRHWDQQGQRYVPCAGDDCPFCLGNDNPWPAALTLWYFPDNDKREQLQVFTMNNATTEDITDTSEEEDGILGKKFRVKRMDDRGGYKVVPLSDKKLTKKEITALLKEAPDLEELTLKELKRQIERLEAADALTDDDDDDDDDDEDEKPKSRRGKEVDDDEEEDEDEDEEDEDSDEDEEEDEDEDEEDESEEDEDDEDEDEEDEEEDDEDEDLEKAEFEVTRVNKSEDTVTVDMDGDKVKMWLDEDVDPDWDEVKKGATVVIDAAKDDEGDFIITALKVKKSKSKSASKSKSSKKSKKK